MKYSLFTKPGFIQIMRCGGEGGDGGGGDDNGGYTSVGDMFDGGGPGQSGDTFGGALGGISNAVGATPRGSGESPSGLAAIGSIATGIGSKSDPATAAIMGAMGGGLPGAVMGYAVAKGKNAIADKGGLAGVFGQGQAQSSNTGMGATRPQARPSNLGQQGENMRGEGGGASQRTDSGATRAAQSSSPTISLSGESLAAREAFAPVANPNYDPANPLSSRYMSNPTYDQLLAARRGEAPKFSGIAQMVPGMNYNPALRVDPLGFAEGGEVQMPEGAPAGTNEKTLISGAIQAVKGEVPEEQAAMALGMFVRTYGREALKDLVDRVKSGELDDTAARSEGKIAGPGDGMNDRVPASIDGDQDVLLSDGEFIIPADVVSGIGNGSSEAGSKELERLMERVRSERTGKSEQPDAINPAAVMPA